jgi:lipopolysaccharide transport system permease protein
MSLRMHLRELWRYRDLLYNLVLRDLKVRYKNSVLGILWSLLNPLLMMVVFTLVFNVLSGSSDIQPYPAFILSGVLVWNLFAASVTSAIGSIVGNAHLIKKVYFPREVLPMAAVLGNVVNFSLALPVYFLLATLLGLPPTEKILLLPAVLLVQVLFTLGISFILATLNVFYRDTQIVMEVVLLAWFFLTPVFYPLKQVLPNGWTIGGVFLESHVVQRLYRIVNPMASIVATYRDILFWGNWPGLDFFMRTAVTAVLFFAAGYLVFLHFCPVFGEEV